PTTDEATWQSDPAQRGKFVVNSSPGMFRLADYNGKFAGSLGAVFLRGDGALSAEIDGVIQQSAIAAHVHGQRMDGGAGATNNPHVSTAGTGAVVSGTINSTGMASAT